MARLISAIVAGILPATSERRQPSPTNERSAIESAERIAAAEAKRNRRMAKRAKEGAA